MSVPGQSRHLAKNPTLPDRGMTVDLAGVAEVFLDEAREKDNLVINLGAPTVKIFHSLIGSKFNTIHFYFTNSIFWTSSNSIIKSY